MIAKINHIRYELKRRQNSNKDLRKKKRIQRQLKHNEGQGRLKDSRMIAKDVRKRNKFKRR